MDTTFTAIDFETAQGYRWSICQIGLVRVENGIVVNEASVLVQPPNNYYWDKNIDVHGITPQRTRNAPTFDRLWHHLAPFIAGQNVVAHNGFGFDFGCLKQTLEYYTLPLPAYQGHCTYKIYKDNLKSLCRKYNIPLNHHDALSDARACAELYKLHLANG
jgi:DNA polymerase-3 subunit epsilon